MARGGYGIVLKQLRQRKGFTQRELARKVGVSRVTIARLEIGYARPSFSLLERLAKVLSVPTSALVAGQAKEAGTFLREVAARHAIQRDELRSLEREVQSAIDLLPRRSLTPMGAKVRRKLLQVVSSLKRLQRGAAR